MWILPVYGWKLEETAKTPAVMLLCILLVFVNTYPFKLNNDIMSSLCTFCCVVVTKVSCELFISAETTFVLPLVERRM